MNVPLLSAPRSARSEGIETRLESRFQAVWLTADRDRPAPRALKHDFIFVEPVVTPDTLAHRDRPAPRALKPDGHR